MVVGYTKCVQADIEEKKVPIDIYEAGDEVRILFLMTFIHNVNDIYVLFEKITHYNNWQVLVPPACAGIGKQLNDGGAYSFVVDSPPDYCEKDPLQTSLNECNVTGGLPRNSTIGSFSSESTGDFSDDDDDDVTDADSGPIWSGA